MFGQWWLNLLDWILIFVGGGVTTTPPTLVSSGSGIRQNCLHNELLVVKTRKIVFFPHSLVGKAFQAWRKGPNLNCGGGWEDWVGSSIHEGYRQKGWKCGTFVLVLRPFFQRFSLLETFPTADDLHNQQLPVWPPDTQLQIQAEWQLD